MYPFAYLCLFYLLQPIYGFTSGDPLRFKRAVGHKDLFYIDDKDVEFKDVRNYNYDFITFFFISNFFIFSYFA
jgi:hypothetical protein